MKQPVVLFASLCFLASEAMQAQNAQNSPKAYVVSDAHLDTQWNWDIQTTIQEYVWPVMMQGCAFLLILAVGLFGLTHAAAPSLIRLLISSDAIFDATKEFLNWRIFGFFFAFVNVMFRALYIGILTSGGDCPGINATIRGVCKTAISHYGMEVYGIRSGFRGLLDNDIIPLDENSLTGLLSMGGTILGTSREKPFKNRANVPVSEDKPAMMLKTIRERKLDCVVCIGGNGTQKTAAKLAATGVNVVTVPKTIDNDVWGTDISFGFDSAVSIATEAIDRLHSTASAHQRVMVIEVMGHKAGWIALYSGMAGGGDIILLPEIPFDIHRIGDTIISRLKKGKPYSIVVVAEGIPTLGGKKAAQYIAEEIEYETGFETRETVLGYIQRGGGPTAFDRNLATRMGGHATELIVSGQFGRMVSLRGSEITSVPLSEVAGKLKLVTEEHDLVIQGRRMGICFG